MLIATNVWADKIQIPFSCYPRQLSEDFARHGYKVDVNAEDRTKDSWAFIKSEGSSFWLYTYYPVQDRDFEMIKEVIWEHLGQ